MKLVSWEFKTLLIAMVKTDNGELLCTTQSLLSALGLDRKQLEWVLQKYRGRFNPLRPEKLGANVLEFLQSNRTELGIKRVRTDMMLWPLKDALAVAFHVHTDLAWEFHQAAIELVEKNASERGVSREEYDAMLSRISLLEQTVPALQSMASLAGASLRAQRDTKALRDMN